MGISMIECGFGYVESNTVGKLLFGTRDRVEFDSEFEALQDLAKGLYRKYKVDLGFDREEKQNSCCSETLTHLPKAKRCAECGNKLTAKSIDFNNFSHWLEDLLTQTCDSYGEEISDICEDSVGDWIPWMSIQDLFERGPQAVLWLPSDANAFLIEALGEDGVDTSDKKAWRERESRIRGSKIEELGLAKMLSREQDTSLDFHVE